MLQLANPSSRAVDDSKIDLNASQARGIGRLGEEIRGLLDQILSSSPVGNQVEMAKVVENGVELGRLKATSVDSGRLEKRKMVRSLVRKVKPLVLFIQELKLNNFDSKAQTSLKGKWCIWGDFNTILEPCERLGGVCHVGSMRNFRRFIYLAQRGLNKSLSDHNPIYVGEPEEDWGSKPFRFANEWLVKKDLMKEALRDKRLKVLVMIGKEIRLEEQKWRDYFKQISWKRPKIQDHVVKTLSEVESLGLEVSSDEVWKALSECDDNKALGMDGLNITFVKSNWEAIKDDFMVFFNKFYRDNLAVKDLNHTFITLIPKVFADDIILFIKPRMDYILNVHRFLRCFEMAICYLGFPLGGYDKKKDFWNPVINKGINMPKVELFSWQVYRGIMMVRSTLIRFGCSQVLVVLCSVSHVVSLLLRFAL
ncbi:hypothetical protein Ddye_009916 [Dipteronia dyeriana]|uniref:Uncharacterized protein n=1 Tax=Dipteronia dyeriana TaxID=168575 RepID=A0AAD9XCD4_9ROSI|nr:hypothetical protein Ddye_009916 [Dipteronia dyeriana]